MKDPFVATDSHIICDKADLVIQGKETESSININVVILSDWNIW